MFRVTHEPYLLLFLLVLLCRVLIQADLALKGGNLPRKSFCLVESKTVDLAGGQAGLHWEVGGRVPLHN